VAERPRGGKVAPEKSELPKAQKKSNKNLFKLRKDHEEIEGKITSIEAELKRVTELLSEDHVSRDWSRMTNLLGEYEKLSRKLEKMLYRWEKIEIELVE
jgi:chaperonin cofactor prefoldin